MYAYPIIKELTLQGAMQIKSGQFNKFKAGMVIATVCTIKHTHTHEKEKTHISAGVWAESETWLQQLCTIDCQY